MHKVLFINSMEKSGGTERVVANLANLWCKKDKITILTASCKKDIFYNLDKDVKIVSLNIEPYKSNSISVFSWLLRIIRSLHAYFKKNKVDVILGIWTSMAICAIIASKLAKVKVKVVACEHISCDLTKKPLKILRRLIYPFADAVIVLTNGDKEKLQSYCKNVVCIENQVSFLSDNMPDYSSKQVLAVGRMVEQKGFDLLLLAWSNVIKNHSDWKLAIVGGVLKNDEYSLKIKRILEEYDLEKFVDVVPPTDKILDYYLESSVFVLPSRFEGLPMVMIEAMAVGMPIVAFDCPTGPRDIIKDNITGRLVKALDINEMTKVLSDLISSRSLREQMGKNAKKYSKKYSIEFVNAKWNDLFKKLNCDEVEF